ncbi:MAG: preprotein translocase subunit SecG [Patescibacteria group bacterium]|nr:preprotein translocase subunit SecG [Patescibacteria group bacterium]
MIAFLKILQVVLSILLALAILSQNRGSGLSAVFGGEGGFYRTKRGAERVLSIATVVLAVLWVLNALAFLFVQ